MPDSNHFKVILLPVPGSNHFKVILLPLPGSNHFKVILLPVPGSNHCKVILLPLPGSNHFKVILLPVPGFKLSQAPEKQQGIPCGSEWEWCRLFCVLLFIIPDSILLSKPKLFEHMLNLLIINVITMLMFNSMWLIVMTWWVHKLLRWDWHRHQITLCGVHKQICWS